MKDNRRPPLSLNVSAELILRLQGRFGPCWLENAAAARLTDPPGSMGEVLSFKHRAQVGKPALSPSARAGFRFVTQPPGKQDVTLSQELAAQTETQAPPVEIPKWVARLFGSGALAITAGWVYLLTLGVGYVWHHIF